jgi:hypothetical protein
VCVKENQKLGLTDRDREGKEKGGEGDLTLQN